MDRDTRIFLTNIRQRLLEGFYGDGSQEDVITILDIIRDINEKLSNNDAVAGDYVELSRELSQLAGE